MAFFFFPNFNFFFPIWLIFGVGLDFTLTALKICPHEILNSNLTFWTPPLIVSFPAYCHFALQQKAQDLSLSSWFGTWAPLGITNNHHSFGNLLIKNNWFKVSKIWPCNYPQCRPQKVLSVELRWQRVDLHQFLIKISHCQNLVTTLLNSRLFA